MFSSAFRCSQQVRFSGGAHGDDGDTVRQAVRRTGRRVQPTLATPSNARASNGDATGRPTSTANAAAARTVASFVVSPIRAGARSQADRPRNEQALKGRFALLAEPTPICWGCA